MKAVNKICKKHQKSDTREFFSKVKICCLDCANILGIEFFTGYEKLIVDLAKDIHLSMTECKTEKLRILRMLVNKKINSEFQITEKRIQVLRVIQFLLESFDDFDESNDQHRSKTLYYCVANLIEIGVPKKNLYKKINHHFDELIS